MTKEGEVRVKTRSDACLYLEYLVDIKEGKYNRYRCNLAGSCHKCMKWGWCPMVIEAEQKKNPLETEFWDIR